MYHITMALFVREFCEILCKKKNGIAAYLFFIYSHTHADHYYIKHTRVFPLIYFYT